MSEDSQPKSKATGFAVLSLRMFHQSSKRLVNILCRSLMLIRKHISKNLIHATEFNSYLYVKLPLKMKAVKRL